MSAARLLPLSLVAARVDFPARCEAFCQNSCDYALGYRDECGACPGSQHCWSGAFDAPMHERVEVLPAGGAVMDATEAARAPTDARDARGLTALHVAALNGHAQVAGTLLDGGASVDAKEHTGWTALLVAAAGGHAEVVRVLLAGGASVEATNHDGRTALLVASYNGHAEVVRALLDGGASVDAKNHEGRAALHFAAYNGQAQVVRALLDGGASVDAKDPAGRTALHFAASYGWVQVSRVLLTAGATFSRTADSSLSPLDLALYRSSVGPEDAARSLELVRVLLNSRDEARASVVEVHPLNGQVAMHLAAYAGQPRMLDLLEQHGAIRDCRYHVQAGDGLQVQGMTAAAREAYAAALRLPSACEDARSRLVRLEESDAIASPGARRQDAAQTVAQLSADTSSPGWVQHAVELWQGQGVVAFPSMLNASMVRALRDRARAALLDGSRRNYAAGYRAAGDKGSLRQWVYLAVDESHGVLQSVAQVLSPFLADALQSSRQLVGELAVLRTRAGSVAQDWHVDTFFADKRVAAVQISLTDTEAAQGALEVLPADASGPNVKLPLPEGSVTLYRLDYWHRGGGHTLSGREDRIVLTSVLVGEHGFVPCENDINMLPEDRGRWWIMGEHVVAASEEASSTREGASPP